MDHQKFINECFYAAFDKVSEKNRRFEKPDKWITLPNGVHVALNKSGKIIRGPDDIRGKNVSELEHKKEEVTPIGSEPWENKHTYSTSKWSNEHTMTKEKAREKYEKLKRLSENNSNSAERELAIKKAKELAEAYELIEPIIKRYRGRRR
jgi:hypothetical protein